MNASTTLTAQGTRPLPNRHRFPDAVPAAGRQIIGPNRHGAWR